MASGSFLDLRLSDLQTFLNVSRTGSVTAAAREMRVTPSQASKALARLEEHYGVKLLTRGSKTMALTNDGRQLMPHISDAVRSLAITTQGPSDSGATVELTLAAPSYTLGFAVAAIAQAHDHLRLRGIELAPSQVRANLSEGLFDLALSPSGVPGRPPTWSSDEIGIIRKVLVRPPALVAKLGTAPLTLDQVRELPFVGALSSLGGRLAPRADDCPLAVAERRITHRVQTFGAALELAVRVHCVVFGPRIAVRRMLVTGELVEIPVSGWHEGERLELLCNGEVVRDRLRKQLITTLRAELVD